MAIPGVQYSKNPIPVDGPIIAGRDVVGGCAQQNTQPHSPLCSAILNHFKRFGGVIEAVADDSATEHIYKDTSSGSQV